MNRKQVGCGRKEVGAAVMLQLIDIQDVGGWLSGSVALHYLGGGWLCVLRTWHINISKNSVHLSVWLISLVTGWNFRLGAHKIVW